MDRENVSLCPSAPPRPNGSVMIGVIGGTAEEPQVLYLGKPEIVTEKLLSMSGQVDPREVFRFAAPCAELGCRHFDGSHCRLVMRTVRFLPSGEDDLPHCGIRRNCRWWLQEGKDACARCSKIVTLVTHPTEKQYIASGVDC